MLFSVTAPGRSSRGTRSPIDACQDGLCSAVPQPMKKVKASSSQGVSRPATAKMASPVDTTIINICATSMILRRSKLSASAPAASEKIIMGSVVAACTNATISSDVEMVVIIQPAPTVWTSPPKLDARVAVQTARKEACLTGAKGETLIRISVPWLGYSELSTANLCQL